MYHPPSPSTPSNPRTRASATVPNTPPSYRAAVPGAPFMGTRPLPPSPSTPTHPLAYGGGPGAVPPAPHMSTVQLPVQLPNPYGLYTPPASPTRPPRNIILHPSLAEGSEALIYWDMRGSTQSARLPHGVNLNTPASTPYTQVLNVSVLFGTIYITVTTHNAYVTIGDVIAQIQVGLQRPMSNGALGIQALQNQVIFAGLAPTSNGIFALATRGSRG